MAAITQNGCLYISLSLRYKIDIHVEMYVVKYIKYKYMNFKLNEHQDDRRNPICLFKIERSNLSKITSEQLYSFPGNQHAIFRICWQYA